MKQFFVLIKIRIVMEEEKSPFTVTDISIKAKSKIKLYRILTIEGDVYLPLSNNEIINSPETLLLERN